VSLEALGVLLGIAIVCSVIAQGLTGYSTGGFIVSTGVGLIGAVFGMWLPPALNIPRGYTLDVGGTEFPLIWAIAGSGLLVAALGALQGNRR